METLREGDYSRGNIKIALIEFENWTSQTVGELLKPMKQNKTGPLNDSSLSD